jgi:hypothetical protein
MKVRFALVCEGPSDAALAAHLQTVCVHCGADEAVGTVPDFGRLPRPPAHDVASRITAALALDPAANLVFVHRDADSRSTRARVREIQIAAENVSVPVVPVVPIQETEAWLLLDEAAIRSIVENPRGTVALSLPRVASIERLARPKERLRATLERASELRGRRLDRFKRDFGRHRGLLLQRLDPSGPITQLTAWQNLLARTTKAVALIADG